MRTSLFLIAVLGLAALCALTTAGTKQPGSRNLVIGYFWAPGSQDRAHYVTVQQNYKQITHLCPTRIAIADTEGNVKCGKDKWLLAFAKRNKIAILPLVANKDFSREIAHAVLNDPAKRTKVVDQLLAIIKDWRCPGINIDIENVAPGDRQVFTQFMEELCARFHENGLGVTIDVPAKTRDAPEADWSGAFDYVALGKCCNLVMLMAYDEHWSTGKPGPIGSRPWVRRCLDYAISTMPKEKVVLGVPWYGYDWPETGRAKAYTSKGIAKLIAEKKPTVNWDDESKYHWFEYESDTGKRTVWYEDPSSLVHKLELAREYGIAGISIWRLGDEDPGYWKLLANYRAGKSCLPGPDTNN